MSCSLLNVGQRRPLWCMVRAEADGQETTPSGHGTWYDLCSFVLCIYQLVVQNPSCRFCR